MLRSIRPRAGAGAGIAILILIAVTPMALGRADSPPSQPLTAAQERILDELPHVRESLEQGENATLLPPQESDPAAVPIQHGPFLLIPPGFIGPIDRQTVAEVPAERGALTDDLAIARQSPLFREPSWLPSGFNLAAARSPFGLLPTNIGLEVIYVRDDVTTDPATWDKLTIRVERIFALPLELSFSPDSPFLRMSAITLSDGRQAVLYEWLSPDEQRAAGVPSGAIIPEDNGRRIVIAFDADAVVAVTFELDGAPDVSTLSLIGMLEDFDVAE